MPFPLSDLTLLLVVFSALLRLLVFVLEGGGEDEANFPKKESNRVCFGCGDDIDAFPTSKKESNRACLVHGELVLLACDDSSFWGLRFLLLLLSVGSDF